MMSRAANGQIDCTPDRYSKYRSAMDSYSKDPIREEREQQKVIAEFRRNRQDSMLDISN